MVRIASCHTKTMPQLLPAILLSAGLQSALAAAPATAAAVPATAAARSEAIVQAQLLVPNDPAPSMGRGGAMQAAKGATKAEASDDDHGVGGMLLAALALMTGIAVRRWGQGQQ